MVMSRSRRRPARAAVTPTDAILDSISDGVFTVDHDWRITSFNRAAEQITGVPRAAALGRPCADVFRSSTCGEDCALRQTLETGKPVIGKSGYIVNAGGMRTPSACRRQCYGAHGAPSWEARRRSAISRSSRRSARSWRGGSGWETSPAEAR
jgi:PAS domain-containing protein